MNSIAQGVPLAANGEPRGGCSGGVDAFRVRDGARGSNRMGQGFVRAQRASACKKLEDLPVDFPMLPGLEVAASPGEQCRVDPVRRDAFGPMNCQGVA